MTGRAIHLRLIVLARLKEGMIPKLKTEYFPALADLMDLLYFSVTIVNLNHSVFGSPPHVIWADIA